MTLLREAQRKEELAGEGDLFVSRYQFELPTEEQLKHWLHEERARLEGTKEDTRSN